MPSFRWVASQTQDVIGTWVWGSQVGLVSASVSIRAQEDAQNWNSGGVFGAATAHRCLVQNRIGSQVASCLVQRPQEA